MTNRELADFIAADLFTNGMGQRADRLVLELPGKLDGGGWCEKAMADRIFAALEKPHALRLRQRKIAAVKGAEATGDNDGR